MKRIAALFIALVAMFAVVAPAQAQTGYFGGPDPAPQPNLGYVPMYNSSSYLHLGNALSGLHNFYFVKTNPTQVGWLGSSGVMGRGHTSYYRHSANQLDFYLWEYQTASRRYCLWWARLWGSDTSMTAQQISLSGCGNY